MGFDPVQFHTRDIFRYAEMIPGIATVSALVRLVAAVGLITKDLFKSIERTPIDGSEGLENDDSGPSVKHYKRSEEQMARDQRIGYNVLMIFDSLITAIPIFGNIQSWLWCAGGRNNSGYEAI